MEEARQHPAVTAEQRLYTTLLFGGVVVLFLGIVLHMIFGGRTIGIAALAFISMRLVMALMRVFLPESVPGRPNKVVSVIWLVIWVGIAFLAIKIALQ